MNVREERLKKLALLFLFLFTFSGVFSLTAVKFNISILKVWKEGLIILLFTLSVGNIFLRKKVAINKLFVFLSLFLPFIVLYFLFSINTNNLLVLYQIKNDLVPLFFVLSLYFIIEGDESRYVIYNKLIKVIVLTAVINSFAIYFESLFPSEFMAYLSIEEFNNAGGASGVRLDNTAWGLRAMGTMTSFINSGTLTFFGLICVVESRSYRGIMKIFLSCLLLSAMLLTTYKSTLIAMFFYVAIKAIYVIFKRVRGAKFIYLFSSVVVFSLMAYSFNNLSVYNSIASTEYKPIAYSSIYLRAIQHRNIIAEMESKDSFFTGLGVGKNGTEGPDESLKRGSKPLDSTFIYLMSNYGFIGVCLYILVLLMAFVYLCTFNRNFDNIAIVMMFYTFSIEFFINNIFSNFPNNIIFYTIIFLSLSFNRRSTEDEIYTIR